MGIGSAGETNEPLMTRQANARPTPGGARVNARSCTIYSPRASALLFAVHGVTLAG
jgi:hypothetical protein